MTVVGLGARNTLPDARDFIADRGTSFPMLWDETAASWRAFEVRNQPAAVLIASDGSWIGRWSGEFDESEVLRLIERGRVASTAVPS